MHKLMATVYFFASALLLNSAIIGGWKTGYGLSVMVFGFAIDSLMNEVVRSLTDKLKDKNQD